MTIVYTSSTLISHVSDSLGRTSLNYFNWAHEKIDSWTLVELSSYARRRKFSVFDHVDTSRSQVNCICLKFTTFCDLRELARMLNEACQKRFQQDSTRTIEMLSKFRRCDQTIFNMLSTLLEGHIKQFQQILSSYYS